MFVKCSVMKLIEQANIVARRMPVSDESCKKFSVIPSERAERAGGDVGRWHKGWTRELTKTGFFEALQ